MYGELPRTSPGRGLGLSLIELLVSMSLGLVLSAVIVTAYLVAKQHYEYNQQIARMQENGRYALRLLGRELAMAGFYGGLFSVESVPTAAVGRDCSNIHWALDGSVPVDLVNDFRDSNELVSVSLITLNCLDNNVIQPGSDLLAIRRTAAAASLVRGVVAPDLRSSNSKKWYLSLEPGELPRWEKLSSRNLLAGDGVSASASYWQAVARVFFVRRYLEAQASDDAVPGLCMETLAGNAMTARCLVEGVEDLQLEFGIDTDDDGVPNRYKSAPTGPELSRAVTARIHLLLRSIHRVAGYKNMKTYVLGGKEFTPGGDAYLRRVFSSTVRLRNRIDPIG